MKTSKRKFTATMSCLLLLLSFACLNLTAQAQTGGLLERITPSTGGFQSAGTAIDAQGVYLAVGTPESSAGSLTNYGTVTVWTRNEIGVYTNPITLAAPDAQSGDRFGSSVQFDGKTLVVGTKPNNGDLSRYAVYVFTKPADINMPWPLQARLTPASAEDRNSFGQAVSLSRNYLAVGAPSSFSSILGVGSVHIYRRVNGVWAFQQRLETTELFGAVGFGFSLSLQGRVLAVGNPILSGTRQPAGHAVIYRRNGNLWSREKFIPGLSNTGFFGYSVSLNGDQLAVASGSANFTFLSQPAQVAIYGYDGADWTLRQRLTAIGSVSGQEFSGLFRPLAVDMRGGDQLILGVPEAAYLFTRDDKGVWSQRTRVTPSDQTGNVGYGTSVSTLASRFFVGAPTANGSGAVYDYTRQNRLTAANVTVSTAPSPSVVGQVVTISVAVRDSANNRPAGLVQLYVDNEPCQLVTLTNGDATQSTSFRCDKLRFLRGTHTVRADYSGSNFHAAASSETITHVTN